VRRFVFAALPCLVVLGAVAQGCGGKILEGTASDGGLDATKPDAPADAVADVVVKPDAPPPPVCKVDADCKDASKPTCDPATKTCVACLPAADTCGKGTYCGADGNGSYACLAGCKGDPDCGGSVCCAHQCSDTTADAKNCGACGNTCGAGSSCCASSCTDTQGSLANCGACGKICAPANVDSAFCKGGTCIYGSCNAGFAECDGIPSNGCETDVTSDVGNCGKCGLKCGLGDSCVGGACTGGACGPNDVFFQGHCYYLDGSGGNCDAGFTRASEAVLAQITALFQGKNYRHAVSQNCCIWTSDVLENYGMMAHCNSNGPFSSGEPAKGAVGCTAQQLHGAAQLTFCGT
jgi:hypothetical protein